MNFSIKNIFSTNLPHLISIRYANKTNVWDSIIQSSTASFTTSEGLELVKNLHDQRKGEFGSAQHIIDRNIKNIKEEKKWSEENLPEINNWLDSFISSLNDEQYSY